MCDLNTQETAHIVDAIGGISALTAHLNAHAAAITETAFMDHEVLAAQLHALSEQAATAAAWVADKPHQH